MSLSISQSLSALQQAKTDIASAIAAKGGTVGDSDGMCDFASDIASITAAAPEVVAKDVNFYDFEGTLLYSYTIAEARALTALPDPPDHSGDEIPLTFDGWNRTLSQVQSNPYPDDIGALFKTTDGKTYLRFRFTGATYKNPTIHMNKIDAGDMTVDWGDGSAAVTVTGTGDVSFSHEYADYGEYTVTIDFEGEYATPTMTSSTYSFGSRVMCSSIIFARLSGYITGIGSYSFRYGNNLTSINMTQSITSLGENGLQECMLDGFVFPPSITVIPLHFLNSAYCARAICLPFGLTTVGSYGLRFCSSVDRLVFGQSLTYIGVQGVYGCKRLSDVCLCAAVPPTPDNPGTAFGVNSYSLVFHVPEGTKAAYGAVFISNANQIVDDL